MTDIEGRIASFQQAVRDAKKSADPYSKEKSEILAHKLRHYKTFAYDRAEVYGHQPSCYGEGHDMKSHGEGGDYGTRK